MNKIKSGKMATSILIVILLLFFLFSYSGNAAPICASAEFPVSGDAGDPFIYGCVDATHGKACRIATGSINPSFVIPNPPAEPVYQRLLQQCSGSGHQATQSSAQRGTSSGGTLCDSREFPLSGDTGDPFVYGCVDAAHGKACRVATGSINPSFVIPNPPTEAVYQRLLQQCSGAASGATTSSGPASCTNPQQCKEIDEVWQRIGSLVRKSSDVWDTRSMPFWKAFSTLYPSFSGTSVVTASGPDAFDSIIREAAAATIGTPPQVEFALIKAIMVAESEFKPNDISSKGCSGLLQICATSAKEEIQVQCPQVRSLGPRKCDPGTCRPHSRDPGVRWCDVCVSGTNCVDDDRFDPRKNIFSATKTIQRKMDAIPVSRCGMECQIAAYNIGEKVILAAIDAAQTEIGSGPLDWNTVYSHITTQLMKDNGYEDSPIWNEVERENKRANLKGYVAKIMRSYQSYKAGTS